MSFPKPTNKFNFNNKIISLDDILIDFQKIVCGAHIAESRFKNEPIIQEVPIRNYDLFNFNINEINEFLEWLTDYDIKLKFTKASSSSGKQQRFTSEGVEYISLFSGGLDSGSLPLIQSYRNRIGILHHTHTSNRMLSVAKKLHKKCMNHRNKLVITKLNLQSFIETPIMHTRGMSFLTNLLCMAEEFNAQEIVIPENGAFMINHPISTIVNPTRTADPLMIEKWSSIFFKILGTTRNISFPFLNTTKSEAMLMSQNPNLIQNTWSCSTSQGRRKMCGICVACFFRILSLYAINQGEDLSKNYLINPFLVDMERLGKTNQHTFRVLLLFLDYWQKLLNPNSVTIDEEHDRVNFLISEYPILVNQASDMFVGLETCLKKFGNSHILAQRAKTYLKKLDRKTLENRSLYLQKQIEKYGWDN